MSKAELEKARQVLESIKAGKPFDLQRFARDPEDVTYRGRRRWNGNHGRLWWDGLLIFEISAFEIKATTNREDVVIGNSIDSKVTGLVGEGKITIKSVLNRNLNKMLEEWKAGHDVRSTLVAVLDDPDMVAGQKERISVDNVWFNELDILHFTKGEVVEKEFTFGFTPEDLSYIEDVEMA